MGWVWSSASISPHSGTSVFVRSDISPLCRFRTGVTVGLCFLLPPSLCGSQRGKFFISCMLVGCMGQPSVGPVASPLDLAWVTQGWQATCRQRWRWWTEIRPMESHLDLLLRDEAVTQAPENRFIASQVWEPTRSSQEPLCHWHSPRFLVQSWLERCVFSLPFIRNLTWMGIVHEKNHSRDAHHWIRGWSLLLGNGCSLTQILSPSVGVCLILT